jgi:hypothetical protein
MTRIIRKAVVVVLILVGAGVAAAGTAPVLIGPPVFTSPPSPLSTGTTTTTGGVTTTTVGDTTTVIGTSNPITTGGTITPTTTTPGTTPTTPGATPTIEQVVAATRTVQPGAPVNAFVVPAANRLVVTDVVITNPGATPLCGASVGTSGATVTPTGTTTPPTTTGTSATGATTGTTTGAMTGTTTGTATGTTTGAATTSAAAGLANTGVLCIPAQTSLTLALTTGLEFTAGQSVVLGNEAPTTGAASGGPLFFHLRGFLISGV